MSETDSGDNLAMHRREGETEQALTARYCTGPEFRAALTVHKIGSGVSNAKLDIGATLGELEALTAAAVKGDLSQGEATLAAQASALDALFHFLARSSILNMGEYTDAADRYMRLALRAQGHCRATIETLAAIKNPAPVAFVRQANIAHGPQQVNNWAGFPHPLRAGAHAHGETEIVQNELLGGDHGERLDTGTAGATGRANQKLEAVGAINRPDHGRGKCKG